MWWRSKNDLSKISGERFRSPEYSHPWIIVVTVVMIICCPSIGKSQWRVLQVIPCPTRVADSLLGPVMSDSSIWITSIYFLDLPGPPRIGFLGTYSTGADSTAGGGQVWKTTDGGAQWKQVAPPLDNHWFFGVAVVDFAFKDSLTGWLVSTGTSGNGGTCYKTTNGGETWERLSTSGYMSFGWGLTVYYHQATDLLFVSNAMNCLVSSDEGGTWRSMPDFTSCAFTDDLNGILCGGWHGYDHIYATTDGGWNWTQTTNITSDDNAFNCLHPLAIPGTKTFFIIEDTIDRHQMPYSYSNRLWRSDNGGMTWRMISVIPFGTCLYCTPYTVRRLFGDLSHIYTQSSAGVLLSTDEGISWKNICGPSYPIAQWDFYISGGFYQKDNYIYASEGHQGYEDAKLWYLNLDSIQYFASKLRPVQRVLSGNGLTVVFAFEIDSSVGVDTAHFVIHYDTASLALSALLLPDQWIILDSSSHGDMLDLTMVDTSSKIQNPNIMLTFQPFVAPGKLSAKVWLDSAIFSGYRISCNVAALSVVGSDSVEIDFTGCGDSTLLRFMSGQSPFEIVSVQPNPASGELDVMLSRATGTAVAYELYDALGSTRLRGITEGSDIALDVSSLPQGIYFFRASTEGATPVSRKIAIAR